MMNWLKFAAPCMLALLASSATWAEDQPATPAEAPVAQVVVVAGQPAPPCAEGAVEVAGAPLPFMAAGLPDHGAMEAVHERVEAKLKELIDAGLLTEEGAAQLRDLFAELHKDMAGHMAPHAMGMFMPAPGMPAPPPGPGGELQYFFAPQNGGSPDAETELFYRLMLPPPGAAAAAEGCPPPPCPFGAGPEAQAFFAPAMPFGGPHGGAMIMVPDSKSLQIRIEDGNVSVDGDNLSDEQKAEIKAHIEQELEMQHGLSSATAVWAVPADAEEKRQLELELSAAGAGALALSPEQLKELEGLKTLRIEGPDGKELLMELESLNGAPGLATTLQPGELAQIELEAARAGELSGQVLSDEELAELSGLTVTLAPDAELAQCELRQGLAIAGDGQGLGLALDGLAVRPGSAELAAELEKLSAALAGLEQSGDKAELESLIEELNDVLEDYTSESDDEDNSDS